LAGYRPCKRCRPDEPVADPWVDKVRRASRYLASVDGHPSLASLARLFGGSPFHLQRNFKRLVGLTPRQFAEACRLRKVKAGLRDGLAVTTAVVHAGYGSSSRFYERAASKLGMPPARYRQGAAGARIRYAVVPSPLGRLLVAATDAGVCAVAMGDDDGALMRALEAEYPAATISRDDEALAVWTERVVSHLEGKIPRLELPLDVRAPAFQWQVWNALAAIPRGETKTYSQVAAGIGRPAASRAVARACATNPVALAIPCHRVVPAAGGVGGYRWGPALKRRLLEREKKNS
jgi:AraC family transcriptional regulator of adaptative response/methylated-DNA-[protein]-cysteine methyltransferase